MSIKKIVHLLLSIRYRYLLTGSLVIVDDSSVLRIGRKVRIRSSKIVVKYGHNMTISEGCIIRKSVIGAMQKDGKKCSVVIGEHCSFDNVQMLVLDDVRIGEDNHFSNGDEYSPQFITIGGHLKIGKNNFLKCRIWLRFGGQLTIGDYNSINQRSEIRADENVTIGSYNMISYDCNIWDTNTHNIYPAEVRRDIMQRNPDFLGIEIEKPVTKPVYIGNDCWVGRYATIMKGCRIGDKCVVAFHAFLSNKTIEAGNMVYTYNKTITKKI